MSERKMDSRAQKLKTSKNDPMNKPPNEIEFRGSQTPAMSGVDAVQTALVDCLIRAVGKHPENASQHDWFQAVAHYVRGEMAERWLRTKGLHHQKSVKAVYYLSMEFLIGRSLKNNLFNLGLLDVCRQALNQMGVALDELYEHEFDAALGNGGLGRLAACFLDSLTTLGYPAYGYGIRYDAGMFSQRIENGWQIEQPENWLQHGNPWEFARPAVAYPVQYGGRLEAYTDEAGKQRTRWTDTSQITAMAYDLQVSGYGHPLVNTIRLWSAKSVDDFNLRHFNAGEHAEAVRDKSESEALSRVLYPDDSIEAGRELRLRQEHFFTSASLQDILGRFLESHDSFEALPEKVAIQLNDTHPAMAIPEMMRLLIDIHGLEWPEAWNITTGVFSYTNHTLMSEALETWPAALLEKLLPRHLDIIYRINDQFLDQVRSTAPEDTDMARRVSVIGSDDERRIHMAHLAIAGSHTVNGVSELHTQIMRDKTFADFDKLFPERLVSKTNGMSSRRWLNQANPELAALISSHLGQAWITRLELIKNLMPFADDADFQQKFRDIKRANKVRLAGRIAKDFGVQLDPSSLFDVHVKRIHEYKRQLLNVLHIIARYNRIRAGNGADMVPRTAIFAGKAASSYHMAKLIIKLINDVAATINTDPAAKDMLRIVFIPNYNVSAAEQIIPAADLSEQISTAGTEASGTGNMKLALNGALTIGTVDGANIEIGKAVGEEHMFFFGLDANEVATLRSSGKYDPRGLYERHPDLHEVLDMIRSGHFSPDDPGRFHALVDYLLDGGDHYMLLADFEAYVACQNKVDDTYRNHDAWTRKAIANVAGMGTFSSDRTIREYADEIWDIRSVCLAPSEPVA